MQNPQQEIYRNMPGDGSPEWEKSFYGYLAEYGEWDIDKFWVFHKALINIAKQVDFEQPIERELAYALIYIQERVLTIVSSHFSDNEFSFTSIEDSTLYDALDRFELALKGAITGEVIPESSFDLVNPLLANA